MTCKFGVIGLSVCVVLATVVGCANDDIGSRRTGHMVSDAAWEKVKSLKSSDGQPLLRIDEGTFQVPPRPSDPSALPETDPGHWYDMEYAGWNTKKENLPNSPGDGPQGKRVLCLRFIDHPYLTAYSKGMKSMADFFGIELETKVANDDPDVQRQQVDQAIEEKPDLVVITPVDQTQVVPLLRKLNRAGIPVIASNILPAEEGMKYVLAWTGPNDWGQFRLLARAFAKKLNGQGGYCVVRHFPGGSPYFSRTFAPITELAKIAPNMECLAKETSNLKAPETTTLVASWLTRFGPRLKGIISADDSGAMSGIAAALKQAGRQDVVVVAAGNSGTGMGYIDRGELYAMTYQSAEADGALPIYLAARWFSGKALDRPVYYLPQEIITKENVAKFLPSQW